MLYQSPKLKEKENQTYETTQQGNITAKRQEPSRNVEDMKIDDEKDRRYSNRRRKSKEGKEKRKEEHEEKEE
jgi:hypothetical protein